MNRNTIRSLISFGTALSLALALVVSVFAQSHAAAPAPLTMDQPCADHRAAVGALTWAETCASLCESADFHMVLSGTGERSQDSDMVAKPVTYNAPQLPTLVHSRVVVALHSHDPPDSALYLTTRRIRL